MVYLMLIGFVMLLVGTLLLLITTWLQVQMRGGWRRDLAGPVFAVAGLLAIGGALVFWAGAVESVIQRLVVGADRQLVSVLVLIGAAVLTVVMCKPVLDLARKRGAGGSPAGGDSSEETIGRLIERIRKT